MWIGLKKIGLCQAFIGINIFHSIFPRFLYLHEYSKKYLPEDIFNPYYMNLFPDEIRMRFESVGNQSHKADPVVLCKFFNPTGAGTWYATEFDPRTNIFYGFVSIFGDWNDEWGCFSLQELRDFRGAFGLGIERDIFFEPKPFSHIGIGKGQIDTEMLV